MSGWDSSAVRGQLQAAATFIEGDEAQELQRIDSAGAALGLPVPFNPDHRTQETEATEAGTWVREDMLITTRTVLVLAATYTWKGDRWTVGESGSHHVGDDPGLYHYSLAKQAI